MSRVLTFMMGEFSAEFPTDRLYAKNHMWASFDADVNSYRFGFAAYAVRLLQDVYFLDWSSDAPFTVQEGQEIGSIESKKAESSLYAPTSGNLCEFNQDVLADPALINVSPYDQGWLFRVEGHTDVLLEPSQYMEHLDAVWEVTQRTIKGQLN